MQQCHQKDFGQKNPKLDFDETVNKTKYFVKNYDFKNLSISVVFQQM